MKYKSPVFGNPMFRMIMIYLFVNLIMLINITHFKSPALGFIVSVIYSYISSVLCGNIFFDEEASWTRILLGFSGVITLLSVGGSIALVLHQLSFNVVILVLVSVTSLLVVLNVKQHGLRKIFKDELMVSGEASNKAEKPKHSALFTVEHFAVVTYVTLAVVSFLLLIFSRSEETRVVWDAVHPAFLPSYFLATFVLLIVILSKVRKQVKIFLVIIHAFLAHSIVIFVFDQLLSGDPWHELGRVRDMLEFGNVSMVDLFSLGYSPYFAIYYGFRKRVYHALLVIFSQMFSVDIYWVAVSLIPVLSSILVPLLMYKIVEMIGGKDKTPILGALLTLSAPLLVWWGTISGPESIGFVFFCLLVYLVLRYLSLNTMRTSAFVFIFVVIFASFVSHFRGGIIAITVFLLAFAFKKYESFKRKDASWTNIQLLLAIFVCFALLPLALFGLYGVYPEIGEMHVRFDMEKLLTTDILSLLFGEFANMSFRELLPSVTIFLMGITGLIYVIVYAPKQRYRYSLSFFLLLVLTLFFVDYRILKFAMVNIPFAPERIWVETYFVAIPFAAIMISVVLKESYDKVRVASSQVSKRGILKSGMITVVFCLAISGLFTLATEMGYSLGVRPPLLNVTPYEVETINFIHRNTAEPYVVVCDAIFATTAYGILGFKSRATYYRYSSEFFQMLVKPSEQPLIDVLQKSGASRAYFVISNRTSGFADVVERTRRVLETYAVFGDGKLFVFRYPPSEQEHVVPLTIDAGNYSRRDYPIDFELNFTEMLLQQRGEGYIDPNSVRIIGPDGGEVASQIDYFQAWFDDCSTSGNWSEGTSDGDVLNYTLPFVGTTGIRGRLIYNRLEMDGGDLAIDAQKYRYLEVKWKAVPSDVSSIRIDLWYKVGNGIESVSTWAILSNEWTVWRYDLSLRNGTLIGLWFDVFSESSEWMGIYKLYVDWIRFVSDTATVRFLYNGEAHTIEQYRILYDFLEHTESGKMDGLPKKLYSNPIRYSEDDNQYNFTWTWDDRTFNLLINKEASEWVGTPGKSFSYVLRIDNSNILTSDRLNGHGGLGVMQTYNSSDVFDANFSNPQLICDGPIMAEVSYQTTWNGSLHIQLYKGQYPTILFSLEKGDSAMKSNSGKYSWLISASSTDDKVYYLKENGEVASEDLAGDGNSGNLQVQSVSQYEVHGYLIVLSSRSNIVGNYSVNFNEFGIAELDFLSYVSTGLNDTSVVFVISKNQSLEEMKNITLGLKNPPTVFMSLPIDLSVRIVDLLDGPLSDVEVEVKELEMKATTDSDGWAHFVVNPGQWTLLASKSGITSEKKVTVSSSYVTRQRLSLVRIDGLVISWWQFTVSVGLILLGSFSVIFLLHRKILASKFEK